MNYNGSWINIDCKLHLLISGYGDNRIFKFFDLDGNLIKKEDVLFSISDYKGTTVTWCSSSILKHFIEDCCIINFNSKDIEFYNGNNSLIFNQYLPKIINS